MIQRLWEIIGYRDVGLRDTSSGFRFYGLGFRI